MGDMGLSSRVMIGTAGGELSRTGCFGKDVMSKGQSDALSVWLTHQNR